MNPFLPFTPLPTNIEHAMKGSVCVQGGVNIVCAHCMPNWPIENLVSYIPVVFVLALRTSASMGMYSGAAILGDSSKKLKRFVSIAKVLRVWKTYYGAESIK